jgi:hypothetical protein
MRRVVVRSTRPIVVTTLTTVAGVTPLILSGGGGPWPPPVHFVPDAPRLAGIYRGPRFAPAPAPPQSLRRSVALPLS